jgi:hypothetical protein
MSYKASELSSRLPSLPPASSSTGNSLGKCGKVVQGAHSAQRDRLSKCQLPDGVCVQKLHSRPDQLVLVSLGRVVQGCVAQCGLNQDAESALSPPTELRQKLFS